MKTPWINHDKMQKICSKQVNIFRFSTVKIQKKSIAPISKRINEENIETSNDICELDIAPSCVNIVATNNPHENDDINKVSELHEKNCVSKGKDFLYQKRKDFLYQKLGPLGFPYSLFPHTLFPSPHTDRTRDLHELSDGINSEHISQVDEFAETDNAFKLVDSTDCKHDFKTSPADETNDTPQTDSTFEPMHPSEFGVVDEMNDILDKEDVDETNPADDTYGKVCSMTIKSPLSIIVEIDDFLQPPIFGDTVQNTSEFLDLNNKQSPQFDTKLFNTTTYYPEQPYCRLICSKIHEIIFLTDTVHTYDTNNKNNHYKSVVVPLHDSLFMKTGETNNNSYTFHDFIHIRVPVVVGEYKIEVCLEENVIFEEDVMRVKEISKEVVLTNCKFVPTQFSQSLGNGTCTVLKGNLFIEGYIRQNIEYTAFHNRNAGSIQKKSVTHLNQLCQKIVLDLIIHLLQVQQVLVSYDGKEL
jgi:hypothetical protein